MATKSLTVSAGDTISVTGSPVKLGQYSMPPAGYYVSAIDLFANDEMLGSLQGGGELTIPAGTTVMTASSTTAFSKSTVSPATIPAGKMVTGLTLGDKNILNGETATIDYGSTVTPALTLADIPTAAGSTLTMPALAAPVKITGIKVNGTVISAGTTVTIPDGATVEVVTEPYTAPDATVTLPTIGAGKVVTDFSLAGATQGQTATLSPGSTTAMNITAEDASVSVTVDYTGTTEPTVSPGTT